MHYATALCAPANMGLAWCKAAAPDSEAGEPAVLVLYMPASSALHCTRWRAVSYVVTPHEAWHRQLQQQSRAKQPGQLKEWL
jgi:hypothetical protein